MIYYKVFLTLFLLAVLVFNSLLAYSNWQRGATAYWLLALNAASALVNIGCLWVVWR